MNWLNKKVTESPYKLAIIGGIVIPLVVSALMAEVQSWFPSLDSEGLEAVNTLLSAPPLILVIVLFILVIVSPILEEVFFRKFLWWFSSLMFSQTTTLIVISILFAAIHGSLFHAIGLLPISFFFGWLRIKTGSIKHCTVAHIANNAAASSLFFL
jgi:uncharacterized protein